MSLTADQARRLGGLAGILFAIIALVALFLPGSPPKADEVDKIAHYSRISGGAFWPATISWDSPSPSF